MINNRQAGRRNRGRNNNNNSRPGGQSRGGSDNGNRIDNRARGNAAQLLEKYRNMARDAQLSGERVNAEYYLQFADHYFRVLADNRARQEEAQGIQQQRQPQRPWDPESDGDDFEGADGGSEFEDRNAYAQQGNGNRENGNRDYNQRDSNRDNGQREQGQREQGPREPNRGDQAQRDNGQREQGRRDAGQRDQVQRDRGPRENNRDTYARDNERRDRQAPQPYRDDVRAEAPAVSQETVTVPREEATEPRRGRGRPPRDRSLVPAEVAPAAPVENAVAVDAPEEAASPRRPGRPRRVREEAVERDEPVGIDLAVLPPAIARADNDRDGTSPDAEEAPRKRTRRVRPTSTEAAE